MNRRVRRRSNIKAGAALLPSKAPIPQWKVARRGRGRPSVSPRGGSRQSQVNSPAASPPAGSWLAAPYALQSSGPTRGIPLVVPGVTALPPPQAELDDLQLAGNPGDTSDGFDDYDAL